MSQARQWLREEFKDTAFEAFKIAWLLSTGAVIGWQMSNEQTVEMAQNTIIIGTPTPPTPAVLQIIVLSGLFYAIGVFVSETVSSVKTVVVNKWD